MLPPPPKELNLLLEMKKPSGIKKKWPRVKEKNITITCSFKS